MSVESTPEHQAVQATADRAELDALIATLTDHQVRQIASVMLALGAMNGGVRHG